MFGTARRGLQAIHFQGARIFFLMVALGIPRNICAADLGDVLKNWLGFGKVLKTESRPETKPNLAPSALSLSSSGTIEGVQKKTSPAKETKATLSPSLERVYHCISGCTGACRLPLQVTVHPPSATGERALSAESARGTLSPQGRVSILGESLICDGVLSEEELRFDCVNQNASCQEAVYKM